MQVGDRPAFGHLVRRHAAIASGWPCWWGVRAPPVDLREVVACRYLLELTEAETAAALGLPAGTVESRLHRAMRVLGKEADDD